MQRRKRKLIQRLISVAILLLCLLPLRASATAISGLYVFGDSLSDTGNVYQASLLAAGTGLPASPYFEGRFCNGYLWVDYLTKQLGLQIDPVAQLASDQSRSINFAYGGATTGSSNTVNRALPGLQQELEQYTELLPQQKADANALYAIWIGANDYLPRGEGIGSATQTPRVGDIQPVANITKAIRSLYNLGARRFLVANLPDLGENPLAETLGQSTMQSLNRQTKQHNQALNRELANLQQSLPQIQLIQLDVAQLFAKAVLGQLSFTDVKTPCFDRTSGKVCSNPDQHLFWDALHPTTAAHRYVANLAVEQIQSQLTPNSKLAKFPAALMLVGTLSLLAGAGVWRKRRSP
jgi:phospholipase/lecithinase/hemolysin